MHLTLMRHGEPIRGDLDALDPGLADGGWAQARRTAPFVLARGVDRLYCSPQRRARETAQVIGDALGLAPIENDGLVEFDHGTPYVHYDDGQASVWRHYDAGDLSPWGLTAEAFHARIRNTIDRLAQHHPGERVLAVCHGGVINAWTCQVLGTPERIQVMDPSYASLHRYDLDGGRWRLQSLNETAPVDLDR
ncbi:Putative phosphoserine phosphatase 2 [Mycolicibacterium vanbaalenii]|uniref:Phosphoserine phosphatase 2 n=1 Tax=Mycolicibacterium vanbaalenii TaxID=110539 RepID=A0A5S9R6P7_MYCVN|nr:histidine phosphatase family protein [Mycolicibacterium vanbaalenii]CAA0129923.1 Putative phosphoserine phosphatase 2 [Mycolicibacterium vanbaalenii]